MRSDPKPSEWCPESEVKKVATNSLSAAWKMWSSSVILDGLLSPWEWHGSSTSCSPRCKDRTSSSRPKGEFYATFNKRPEEIKCLKTGKPILKASPFIKLILFLDNNGLLHHLNQTEKSADIKNPIILPAQQHLTTLLVWHYHESLTYQLPLHRRNHQSCRPLDCGSKVVHCCTSPEVNPVLQAEGPASTSYHLTGSVLSLHSLI